MVRRVLAHLGAALAACLLPKAEGFFTPWTRHQLAPARGACRAPSTAHRTGRELVMIDNFFRLHEKNRKLNFDELFTKARYDFPQVFASGAVSFEEGVSVEAKVKAALRQALSQLPASAGLDMAIVSITTENDATLQSALQQLSLSLPGSTRVIGWVKPRGGAVASSMDESGTKTVAFQGAGGIQITLASLSAVEFHPFFASEEQLSSWGLDPVTGLWEKLIGVGLNQAYKDPPVFFMFGRVQDPFSLDLALEGLDAVYPATAKIGGAVFGKEEIQHARLLSRLPGRDGAAIYVEEQPGVIGLAISGDLRALVYATQGLPSPPPAAASYVVESVSKDGRKILSLKAVDTEDIKSAAEVVASVASAEHDLVLGLGGPGSTRKDEGADRWSFVSVRGSKQSGVRFEAGKWQLDQQDGGITMPRVVKPGQLVWWTTSEAKEGREPGLGSLVKELKDEIENDWKQSELGVMRFRPSGVLIVKDSASPPFSAESLNQLADVVPTTFVGGFEAPGQLAPWDPDIRSAWLEGSVVVNVFACKAKRRDPREVRFDYRRPWKNGGLGSIDNVLDLCFDPIKHDEKTGELMINRKAALIGTDVRVENMAWNVREERVVPSGLLEALVWSKERELQFVREDAPLLNLMKNVMTLVKSTDPVVQTQVRGRDVRAAILAKADDWAVVGEVMKGTPLDGVLLPVYDAASVARELLTDHSAAAISIRVDQTYYGGKFQDLVDVRQALDCPVIADDLILYPYQTYLSKMYKADGIKLSLQVLSNEDLLYQVKICATLFVTPIMVASSLHQLRQATSLLSGIAAGAIVSIDDRDQVTMQRRSGSDEQQHVAAEWLTDPEVQKNLQAATDKPVILIEGTRGVEMVGEARKRLQALGVTGSSSHGQVMDWT